MLLSAEDSAETIVDAAAAFCLDDALADESASGEGDASSRPLTKAELLAQSIPFDAARALAVVQVRGLGTDALNHPHL